MILEQRFTHLTKHENMQYDEYRFVFQIEEGVHLCHRQRGRQFDFVRLPRRSAHGEALVPRNGVGGVDFGRRQRRR